MGTLYSWKSLYEFTNKLASELARFRPYQDHQERWKDSAIPKRFVQTKSVLKPTVLTKWVSLIFPYFGITQKHMQMALRRVCNMKENFSKAVFAERKFCVWINWVILKISMCQSLWGLWVALFVYRLQKRCPTLGTKHSEKTLREKIVLKITWNLMSKKICSISFNPIFQQNKVMLQMWHENVKLCIFWGFSTDNFI